MGYNVMDLDAGFWDAMVDAFWDYTDNQSMWYMWHTPGSASEFCPMYCGA